MTISIYKYYSNTIHYSRLAIALRLKPFHFTALNEVRLIIAFSSSARAFQRKDRPFHSVISSIVFPAAPPSPKNEIKIFAGSNTIAA